MLYLKGYARPPGVLHKLFNSHYHGRPVAFSTASKWLRGVTLPNQEKLEVLAAVLDVEPHVLRYGGSPRRIGDNRLDWKALAPEDAAACTANLTLPPKAPCAGARLVQGARGTRVGPSVPLAPSDRIRASG